MKTFFLALAGICIVLIVASLIGIVFALAALYYIATEH